MMSVNLNDTAILNKNGADYHNIIIGIIKSDALNLLKKKKNADLANKEILNR